MPRFAHEPAIETVLPLREPAPFHDVGGPVAAIQRSIMERMAEGGTFEIAVARAPEPAVVQASQLLSRCLGPVALGAGYLLAAYLLLG